MINRAATIFGVILIVLGFIAYLSNPIVGDASFFDTNTPQNFWHILTGIFLLIAGTKTERVAATTLTFIGVLYILLAILGFSLIYGKIIGFLENNLFIEILYVIFGLLMAGFGRMIIFRD